jgi:hypothetical protein
MGPPIGDNLFHKTYLIKHLGCMRLKIGVRVPFQDVDMEIMNEVLGVKSKGGCQASNSSTIDGNSHF